MVLTHYEGLGGFISYGVLFMCSVYMYGCECGVHMCACVYVCVHESTVCVCVCKCVCVWRGYFLLEGVIMLLYCVLGGHDL